MPGATRLAVGAIAGLTIGTVIIGSALVNTWAGTLGGIGHHRNASVADLMPPAVTEGAGRAAAQPASGRSKSAKSPPTLSDLTGLTVTIDSISPSTLTVGSRLNMSGTLTNDSDHEWTKLQAYLEMSTDPATTKGVLDDFSVTGDTKFGERVIDIGFFNELGDLQPGESTAYHLSVPYRLLPASGAVGVYHVGVAVLGTTPDGARDANADARADTTIPLVSKASPHQATRIVTMIPFTAPVLRQPDGTFLDDSLAADVGDGGRLKNLLNFVSDAPPDSIQIAVDPAVLDAIQDMAQGYQVQSIRQAIAGDKPTTGTGQDAAAAWLQLYAAVANQQPVVLLPWGNPDTSGLAANRVAAVVDAAVRASRRYAAANALDLNEVLDWQNNGSSTRHGLAAARSAGATGHVVSQTTLTRLEPTDENGYPPSVVAIQTRRSGPLSTVVTRADVGGWTITPTTTALELRQDILAEATIRAISSTPDPTSVVAVPFHWDPGPVPPDLDLTGAFASKAIDPVPLGPVAGGPSSDYIGPVQGDPAGPGYAAGQITQIRRMRSTGRVYTDLFTANRLVSAAFDQQFAMSGSSAWQWQPRRGEALTRRTTNAMAKQVGQVTVTGPDFVALSSESGRFPLTVSNALAVPVTIDLRVIPANPALAIQPLQPFTVDPGSKQDVEIETSVTGSGVTSVRARLATASGRAFGRPWSFDVRATHIGLAIWILMAVLGAALFSSAAIRIVRRARSGGFKPRGEQP